jgi:uncharacterized lipoprotein YddW (UPF0748 family)
MAANTRFGRLYQCDVATIRKMLIQPQLHMQPDVAMDRRVLQYHAGLFLDEAYPDTGVRYLGSLRIHVTARLTLLPLLLLPISAGPAAAQLVVVRGPDPAAARVEALLQFAGFSYRPLAATTLTQAALEGARTVVLLRASLAPGAAATLAQFAAAGGKLVLVGQEGPPDLYRAVGAEATPSGAPARFERIERTSEAGEMAGLPVVVRDLTGPALAMTPLPGTLVLARRASGDTPAAGPGPAAVTLAPGGAAIDALFAPGDRWEKSWLLQGVLCAVDPTLAEAALQALRRQAADALQAAAEHWARARDDGRLPRRAREERLRTLQALRAESAELPRGAGSPAPASAGHTSGEERSGLAAAPALQAFIQRVRRFDLGLIPSRPEEIRGIWIHIYAPTDWNRVARRVKAAGLNCLVVRVGRGGNVIYPSALLPRDAWAEKAGGDELQRAIEAAHRHGLRFIAWRVNFHMGSAPRAYRDRMAAEDRLVRDSHGVQADFANPGDPRNTELEFQVMRELVRKYDVDGVQFDYIRYPDAPSYDYDYGPVSRREFEKRLGRPVADWPADVLNGPLKTAYEDWERENVSRLVQRVYREVKRLKPDVQVSAAVWRNHRRYRALLKQDWPLWVERGWLDFVVPMDYTPEPDTFGATVDAQVALTRGRVPLAAGIGSWLLQTPEELVRQVEITREAGAAGFVLFAYNAEQIEEQLEALSLGATAVEAQVPWPAPRLQIAIGSSAITGKDTPLAVLAGSRLQVWVEWKRTERLKQANPGQDEAIPRTIHQGARKPEIFLSLERPDGELIRMLGVVPMDRPGSLTGVAPAGRFQPVVRGVQHNAGRARPFAIRGPLAEGLLSAEIAALRAQERPPVFAGGADTSSGPRVGVYVGGLGAQTTLAALATQPGLRVGAVYRLRPDHLAAVDVLVLPQLADVAELDAPTQRRLRRWVERGGTLILSHDAIGARWHPRLFPEIVRDAMLSPTTVLQTVGAVAALPPASIFHHRGGDQFRITPGPAARLLLSEVVGIGDGPSDINGPAVVVAGRVGRGTVIAVGFLSGSLQTELSPEETRLLAALAQYRTPVGAM